jgi:YesN/AraC family two-component response regulator
MIVDDEELILQLMEQILEATDYVSRCALGAAEALDMLRERPADLLITDIRMPGMDGLAFGMQVRQEFPDTRIVLMTGYFSEFSRGSAEEIGIEHILKKPFKSIELLKVIEQVVNAPVH